MFGLHPTKKLFGGKNTKQNLQTKQFPIKSMSHSPAAPVSPNQKLNPPEADSDQDNLVQPQEEFNSDQSWSQLDDLEQHLFNGSHEEESPQDLPLWVRRRDKNRRREEEMLEYEEALQAVQLENNQFIPLGKKCQLNFNAQEYQKMIQDVIQKDKNERGVAKMLGLKSARQLHKYKLHSHMNMISAYLNDCTLPEAFVEQNRLLLQNQGCKSTKLE